MALAKFRSSATKQFNQASNDSPDCPDRSGCPTNGCVFFFGPHHPQYGFLSQWHRSHFQEPIEKKPSSESSDKQSDEKSHNFNRFFCAEQYMMYHKANLFDDEKTAQQILNVAPTNVHGPKLIKHLGRQVSKFSEHAWSLKRESIVFQGNYLKFTQNPDLAEKLIQLGDQVMLCRKSARRATNPELLPTDLFVEASPYDKIWGIGFCQADAMTNRHKWGTNLLGKQLTNVYYQLKNM